MELELRNEIVNDKYTEYVYEAFDIQNREETIEKIKYDLSDGKNFDWQIGLILGSSGSGKTTILKRMGDIKEFNFCNKKPLISNFDWLSPDNAARLLMSMGLSSVPTWLRPYNLLSNGEQYRAKLAYAVGSAADGSVILIDEFTSVVDRDVAKAMSYALQKYIRRSNKKIILASCHYDIIDWLLPDWTCSPQNGGSLERRDCRRRERPNIELQISRVEYDTWDMFKKHHYLTDKVSKSCKFFLFTWGDIPVGINAVIPQPSGHFKNGVRESRIVVLPDFQGLGLGTAISNITASIYKHSGYRYFTKTVHPAIGEYRNRNQEKWRPTSKNGKSPKAQNSMGGLSGWNVLTRTSYCHEYIGDSLPEYEHLLASVSEMRDNNNKSS